MRALYFNGYGPPDVLLVGDLPDVNPGPGEVRIAVAGAGLNPVDAKIRSGLLDGMFPIKFPVVTGWDVAGHVDSVGEGVGQKWLDKAVYAYARGEQIHAGTCAQYCVVPEDVLAAAPNSIPLIDAAAVPLVALTAYQAMNEEGAVCNGDTALILAGGGAVGRYAIQLAKAAGAQVITTARPSDHEGLIGLGADHCVDYRARDWATKAAAHAPKGYDIILDGVGGETLKQSYGLLAPNGRLIGLNDPPEQEAVKAQNAKAVRLFSSPNGAQLSHITSMIEDGALKPLPVSRMRFAEGVAAHALLDKGTKQKIVLTP